MARASQADDETPLKPAMPGHVQTASGSDKQTTDQKGRGERRHGAVSLDQRLAHRNITAPRKDGADEQKIGEHDGANLGRRGPAMSPVSCRSR